MERKPDGDLELETWSHGRPIEDMYGNRRGHLRNSSEGHVLSTLLHILNVAYSDVKSSTLKKRRDSHRHDISTKNKNEHQLGESASLPITNPTQ